MGHVDVHAWLAPDNVVFAGIDDVVPLVVHAGIMRQARIELRQNSVKEEVALYPHP
jgi:hypothetical protein